MRLLPYCISSAVAIIPWSILFCYFGSLARNITEILEGKAGPSGTQSMMLLAVSGVVLVFVVVYSTIIARYITCNAASVLFWWQPICQSTILTHSSHVIYVPGSLLWECVLHVHAIEHTLPHRLGYAMPQLMMGRSL